ncbi:DUF3304 domain-containing protein [Stenotrophomonas maltophilia]|uniref:DUF3304 domain-containing protein n=1 Tax=Stenotrophomonas maltophilia TaxID=40324 RepID=UPI0038C011C7
MFVMKRVMLAFLAGPPLLLSADAVDANAIYGVNHTHWAINRFSVDGRSAVDSIGPYQGGGGGCCYMVPDQWRPGMMVRVDWETGVGGSKGFPGFADEAKYDAWLQQIEAQKRNHSKIVPVPDYINQKVCGITVHFLPCDEIQSPPPVMPTAAPSTRSGFRLSCQNRSHAGQNVPTSRRPSDGRVHWEGCTHARWWRSSRMRPRATV